jgi:hypothetical protein
VAWDLDGRDQLSIHDILEDFLEAAGCCCRVELKIQ